LGEENAGLWREPSTGARLGGFEKVLEKVFERLGKGLEGF
jgi:hypothetical protein